VSFLSAPLLLVAVLLVLLVVPVSEDAFEPQPAPISATVARAASGHGLLLM
jgi:hypothetical protein